MTSGIGYVGNLCHRISIAVVVLCGPDGFIYDFMKNASSPERDMIDGANGEYMYLSIQTVYSNVLHPWYIRDGDEPSAATLKAYRNLLQVNEKVASIIAIL